MEDRASLISVRPVSQMSSEARSHTLAPDIRVPIESLIEVVRFLPVPLRRHGSPARGYNQNNVVTVGSTMATDRMTTISVHASTLRMLQPFKKGDMTWDDVLIGFIEEHVPRGFVRAMIR